MIKSKNVNNKNSNLVKVPFQEVQTMKSFPGFSKSQTQHRTKNNDDDKSIDSLEDNHRHNKSFNEKAKAEILKSLKTDKSNTRRRWWISLNKVVTSNTKNASIIIKITNE